MKRFEMGQIRLVSSTSFSKLRQSSCISLLSSVFAFLLLVDLGMSRVVLERRIGWVGRIAVLTYQESTNGRMGCQAL